MIIGGPTCFDADHQLLVPYLYTLFNLRLIKSIIVIIKLFYVCTTTMLLPTHTDTASAQLQRISLYPIFSSGLTIIGSYRDFVSIRQASRLSVACNLDRWHRLNQLPAECDSHEHRNKVSQNSAILMSINDFINDFSIWMSFRLINHPLVLP